ncbi:hypothetical protein D4R51_04575 [bacterium]|nr:MAG: hypothetical protein D4R51_04575 [bacterium]
MSLTSFLTIKDVKEKFSQEFPLPEFDLKKKILAPPLTRNFSLVGTAFDYLLRFYLERLNPRVITRTWVAENAPEEFLLLKGSLNEINLKESLDKLSPNDRNLFKKIQGLIKKAKETHLEFLKTGRLSDKLIKSALLLAQLDIIYRAGYIYANIGKVNPLDVKDLKKLLSLINPKNFKVSKMCFLNPTFGMGSQLVGGADADLIIDGTLIDIKTTKLMRFNHKELNQLIGYYTLSKIGGVGNPPRKIPIEKLGIYYARYNMLYEFPLAEVINKKQFPDFIKWFQKRAEKSCRSL